MAAAPHAHRVPGPATAQLQTGFRFLCRAGHAFGPKALARCYHPTWWPAQQVGPVGRGLNFKFH